MSAGDCTPRNKWVPLRYPSSAIFAPRGRRGAGRGPGEGRSANPFFPLHEDVCRACLRELLIFDGRIDPRTLAIMPNRERSGCKTALGSKDADRRIRSRKSASGPSEAPLKRKGSCVIDPMENDDDEQTKDVSTFKKPRTQDASVDSLASLQQRVFDDCGSELEPHVVPDTHDHVPFDYAQFNSAEYLVDHAFKRVRLAYSAPSVNAGSDESNTQSHGKQLTTSKRKVSDVDESTEEFEIMSGFSTGVVSLVRSNIMLLQSSQTGSKVSKMIGNDESIDVAKADESIISFLCNPKLQREQQLGKSSQNLLVLPTLLEAAVEDEYCLRGQAHRKVLAIFDAFPGNDLDTSLRAIFGYKSTKTPSRDRLLEMIADVLFDVSHAMYAWIHTEKGMARSQEGKVSFNEAKRNDMDAKIKASLFDDRAIKRIGGFEPASLLPLALGIYRCRCAEITWKKYALSHEGILAMSIHTRQCNDGDNVNARGESVGNLVENSELLELGRRRRGQRSKSTMFFQH
ncbi:hypothetical protein ACHAWF_003434 [Thalassiosira exigua]